LRQSNIIFGAILFAFIVYITIRDQLPSYLDLFNSKPKVTSNGGGGGTSSSKIKSVGSDLTKLFISIYGKE